jgi:predicted KAP-like P-loop ATPase
MEESSVNTDREPLESDRPIQTANQDRLGRWEFARRIAQVVSGRRDASSIVVGLYAPWGEGKTSVLNMIVQELETHGNILIVRFNPWRFHSESHLLKNFFDVLADKLGKSLVTRGEKVSKFFRDYADVLAPFSYVGIDASDAVKGLTAIRPEADLEELKSRIEKFLEEADQRVVIIMDDIDRLDRDEIQSVFKLVKLSADFPNTAYILAFDEERVAQALHEKYGSFEAGRNYIEKIVQVPLHLPPAHELALRSITFEGIDGAMKLAGIDLSEEEGQKFVISFLTSFQPYLKTPRLAKRYVNGLTFALPLLKGEVDSVDLMLIEAVRVFLPRLYSSIRSNGDVFLGKHLDRGGKDATDQALAIIEDALKDISEGDKRTAKRLIKELFPRMGGINLLGGAIHGSDWQPTWSKHKRIAAVDYFDRYFSYGVPPHDVGDQQIDELLKGVATNDIDHVVKEIRALAMDRRASVFVSKLRAREDKISSSVASRLALGIALCGDVFPNDGGMLGEFGASTSSQACILIRHLVQRLSSEDERNTLALQIADQITPLTFGIGYLRWIRNLKTSEDDSQPDNAVISGECETKVNKRIVERIAEEATEDLLTQKYKKDAKNLYQWWSWTDEEGLRQHLTGRFKQFPAEASEFLRNMMREGWSLETGITFEMDLDRNSYTFISSIVDPEIVMTALRQTFNWIDDPKETLQNRNEISKEERAAVAFSLLHRQAQEEINRPSESIGSSDVS